MKKKINLFIAMILSVTMLFGSTVCFAAENEVDVDNTLSVQSNESVRVARSMTNSKIVAINVGDTGVIAYVNLNYAWDEGYTGWFTDASFVITQCSAGTRWIYQGFSKSPTGNSSYITVTVSYIINDMPYSVSETFYVDEWGELYYN